MNNINTVNINIDPVNLNAYRIEYKFLKFNFITKMNTIAKI